MDEEIKKKKKRSRLEAMMFSVSVLSIFLAVIVTAMNAGDAYAVDATCPAGWYLDTYTLSNKSACCPTGTKNGVSYSYKYDGDSSCLLAASTRDQIGSCPVGIGNFCSIASKEPTIPYYTVTFQSNGGLFDGGLNSYETSVQKGTNLYFSNAGIPPLSRSGYTQNGWHLGSSTGQVLTGFYTITTDTVFYANWVQNSSGGGTGGDTYYTVTFQSNGGLFSTGLNSYEKTVAKGTDLYFDSAGIPSLSRSGYTQDGWRLGTSSGEIHRNYYTINADIFFYANWVPNGSGGGTGGGSTTQYTVTFYPNGGTFANGESTYSITRNAGDEFWFSSIGLPSLTRSGCTQDGWHFGSTTGEIHRDKNVVNSDLSYYANWECSGSSGDTSDKQYTLKYDNNGGTGNISSVTKDSGTTVTIGKTVPKREGYTFKEWNTKKDGKGTSYKEGSTIKLESDVTLYAIWEKAKLTIEFYSGDKVYKKVEVNYGEKLAKIDGPKKDGAIFKGWSTSDYTVELYDFDKEVKSSFKLYAVFEPDTGNKTVDGDKTEEEVMPPQTGIVLVIITWLVGLGSLGFSVWYHNRNKNLV